MDRKLNLSKHLSSSQNRINTKSANKDAFTPTSSYFIPAIVFYLVLAIRSRTNLFSSLKRRCFFATLSLMFIALNADDLIARDHAYTHTVTNTSTLTVVRYSRTEVELSWIDDLGGINAFEVERKFGASGEFVIIAEVEAGVMEYIDKDIVPDSTISYRVRSLDGSSSSTYSNEVTVKAKGADYFIPEEVKVNRMGKSPVEPLEKTFPLDLIDEGIEKNVFIAPPCLAGDIFVGFQLEYDLKNKNTQTDWSAYLEISLFFNNDSLWTKSLQVDMNSQTFISTVFHEVPISCMQDYRFVIHKKNISGPVPEEFIHLKILNYLVTEVPFDPNALLSLNGSFNNGMVSLSWNYPPNGKEFDVEWVFIEEHETFSNSTAKAAFDSKQPVRITTTAPHYEHLTYYPKGKLFYRVRAVGYNPEYPEHRITGKWFDSQGGPILINNQQTDMNWQLQTVFSEEGLYKKVMDYYDGSMRKRQSLTNLGTEELTLVGESLYDFEGRKAVDIMPVPANDYLLNFKTGFNNFNSNGNSIIDANTSLDRKKFHYDNHIVENSTVSDVSGAGKYYSPVNTLGGIHSMVPDAMGYVYSQTVYTQDVTGRVSKQSGPGKTFKTDRDPAKSEVDHTVRYFYGEAAEDELIRLFGSNVGKPAHYKKNLVVDGNGQVSVSYVDQEGKVVATALAGVKPDNLEGLESYESLDPTPINVSVSDKNKIAGGISITSHRLLNEAPGNKYDFQYDLSALASDVENFGCKTCTFDLEITLTDPDGRLVELPEITGNDGADRLKYLKKGISAENCTTASVLAPVIFSVVLRDIGDYTLTKKLIPRELSFTQMKELVEENATALQAINEIKQSYLLDASQCEVCLDLDECTEASGIIDETISEIAALDCENILINIKEKIYNEHGRDYEITEAMLEQDPKYCQYKFCLKNQPSDIFEKQMARMANWDAALVAGYNNSLELDPFFAGTLSGAEFKSDMQAKLNNIFVANIKYDSNKDGVDEGRREISGSILELTDPANTAYYLDDYGNQDSNGKHLLFWNVMSERPQMTEEAYQKKLNEQRWIHYKSFYLETKRKLKLGLQEVQDCPALVAELKGTDDLPWDKTEEEIVAWGRQNHLYDTISNEQLEGTLFQLESSCNITLNDSERASVKTNLKAYFNSNKKNFFAFILKEDQGVNQNLIDIEAVLNVKGCSLDSIAVENPLVCVRDTTIYLSGEVDYESRYQSLIYGGSLGTAFSNEGAPDSFMEVNNEDIVMGYFDSSFVDDQNKIARSQKFNMVDLEDEEYRKQYKALMDLFYATGGPNWKYKNLKDINSTSGGWIDADPDIPEDVSDWFGVITDLNGNIVGISLNNNNLSGSLPVGVENLINLENLSLNRNNLSGFQTSIGNLLKLKTLDLSNNTIQDSIPSQIGNLANLERLYVNNGQLYGKIPSSLGSLHKLKFFFANSNNLSDSIPSELGNIGSLLYLWLHDNELIGNIPPALGNLSLLLELNLSSNRLTSSIPLELGDLMNLTTLKLNFNLLSDTIPKEINRLVKLKTLALSNNELVGLPPSLSNLTLLKELSLRKNKLLGKFPHQVFDLISLEFLDLSDNEITDSIPKEIGSLTSLRTLKLSNNKITGNIPIEIGDLSNLFTLSLDQNQLKGSIPHEIGELVGAGKNLHSVNISHNRLYGEIPVSFTDLFYFSCEWNYFTFSNLLPIAKNFSGSVFYYSSQNRIDTPEVVKVLRGETLTLSTDIDRNTSPLSKYAWYKIDVDNESGGLGKILTGTDTASHTLVIENFDEDDVGFYSYQIYNDSIDFYWDNSGTFSLHSQYKKVEIFDAMAITICLEYDQTNPTISAFNFEVDWDVEIARCMRNQQVKDSFLIEYAVEKYIEQQATTFYKNFSTKCLKGVKESLQYKYTSREYHYTLYYYDQAKNLVQTVPPKGVKPLSSQELISFKTNSSIKPAHELLTRYKYNSLNQLTWQDTPDGGSSEFFYNSIGQLRLSKNAKQNANSSYSYSKYDALGRITEVGEMSSSKEEKALLTQLDSIHFPEYEGYALVDITRTHYDKPHATTTFSQENLRSRVSWVEVIDNPNTDTIATFYTYDIHGNVKSLLQNIPGLPDKRTDYVYDLVSGNVNYVMYQFDQEDQFVHRYKYDADNRLEYVYTSSDRYIWDKEAEYAYYQHGPLAKVYLGQYNVQGLDYYYTLQGWLKGVNMPFAGDPGTDGYNGSMVSKDAFAFTLGYYKNDYKAVDPALTHYDSRDQLWVRNNETMNHEGLFNGNISWMTTDLPSVGQAAANRSKGMQAMLYKYDQLNRITKARSLTSYSPGSGFAARSTGPEAYDVDYSYDPNGNLLTLLRRDQNAGVLSDYNYDYYNYTNRLKKVEGVIPDENYFEEMFYNESPLVPDGNYYQRIYVEGPANVPANHTAELKATDFILLQDGFTAEAGGVFTASIIDPQNVPDPEAPDANYVYDEIGNLIADKNEGIEKITWTAYGKIRRIQKKDGVMISFRYDGSGNRVQKWVGDMAGYTTYQYVRDASGNVMAVYEKEELKEQPIYGSSRLGIHKGGRMQAHRTLGSKSYELSNHLGNVLAVVTDNINKNADSAWASVVSTSDYYPYGLNMAGRSWNDSTYRYGFGGQEKDDEVKGMGNWYSFGDYGYDPRIVQRPSRDLKWRSYPSRSPYAVIAGNPIRYIDPNGLEPIDPRTGRPVPDFNLNRAAVYDSRYIDRAKLKMVRDNDLYSNANPWFKNERNKPDGLSEGAAVHVHENVWEHTSSGASNALGQITGLEGGADYGAPNDAIWRNVAEKGSYIFVDDKYAESEWFFINQLEYNVTTVEENYITQIVNLTRPDDNSKFNINSVTSFDIQKGDIQTRQVGTWWGGTRSEKYRILTVTETTQQYKNNEDTGTSTSKTYTSEEIIK